MSLLYILNLQIVCIILVSARFWRRMESDVTVQAGAAPEKKRKADHVSDETVFCWGAHTYGQLGLGEIDDEQILTPRKLTLLPVEYFESFA